MVGFKACRDLSATPPQLVTYIHTPTPTSPPPLCYGTLHAGVADESTWRSLLGGDYVAAPAVANHADMQDDDEDDDATAGYGNGYYSSGGAQVRL